MITPAPGAAFPVGGDPAAVVDAAAALQDLSVRIGAITARLHDLRTMAVWDSPSGERFDEALRAFPDVLLLLQQRYASAAEALLRWVVDLRSAIHDSSRAAERHLEARVELDAIARDLQAAGLDPAGAWYEHLRTRQVLALSHASAAEEQCGRAWRRLEDAAADCAARLRAAAQDSMVDSTAYATVRTARNVAESVGMLAGMGALVPGPQQGLLLVAAGAGTTVMIGADLLLLLGYGDGSFWTIARDTGVALAGRGARTLSEAAGVGATKVNGVWRGEQRGTLTRIRQGHRELSARLGSGPLSRAVTSQALARTYGVNQRWQMAVANGQNAVRLETTARALLVVDRSSTMAERGEYVTRPSTQPRTLSSQHPDRDGSRVESR